MRICIFGRLNLSFLRRLKEILRLSFSCFVIHYFLCVNSQFNLRSCAVTLKIFKYFLLQLKNV